MAYARLTAFPPLNQTTVLQAEQTQVHFTAHVRWSHVRPKYPIDVALCYTFTASDHQSKWKVIPLVGCNEPSTIGRETVHAVCFETSLPRSAFGSNSMMYVTYKYRTGPTAPWLWVEIQQGVSPARILLQQSHTDGDQNLTDYLELFPGWNQVQRIKSDCLPILLRLESTVSIPRGAEGRQALSEHALGRVKAQVQYMALVRLEPYWLGARQGRDYLHLDEDAVLCSFLEGSGRVVTILTASSHDEIYSVIRSNENGEIVIAARCDVDQDVPFQCIIAVANTIEESISCVMDAARETVNNQSLYKQIAEDPSITDISHGTLGSWYDGLTFCTWNALGQDLSELKILSALSSLSDNDIRISTLLIDDNWQILGPIPERDCSDSFNRGLWEMTANHAVAPEGLKSLTSKIRSLYPHVIDIGVWHALMGYWAGISPTGNIAKEYDIVAIPSFLMDKVATTITSIAPNDLPRFYDDLYGYLSSSGITFVKTDVQHMLSTFQSPESRRKLVSAYQSAWTASYTRHFGGKAISCMSQIPEILFSSLLQSHTPRVMARNSDDFYPEVAASHPWHIWTNAHNALLTQHLNVLPDWDMFQTDHSYSVYHAAARCISGGPITITDVPGCHDLSLLKQITALDPHGRSIALRPNVAKIVGGFEEYKEGNVLKIGTSTDAGFSMLGIWNIAESTTSAFVAISDFPTIRERGNQMIVYNYQTKQVFGPYNTADFSGHDSTKKKSLILSEMEIRGWEILTACPVQVLRSGHMNVSVAILGLIDKMSGAAAITSTPQFSISDDESFEMTLALKAVGTLGLCLLVPSNVRPLIEVITAGCGCEVIRSKHIEYDSMYYKSSATKIQVWTMTVDLETVWRKEGLFSRDFNFVDVGIKLRISAAT